MACIIVICVLNDKKLSSHMSHISEYINSSNQKIHSYDQMVKMIVNLVSKKIEKNSTCQLIHLKNLLLMSIVDTSEKYLPNVDRKSDMRKLRTSSVNLSSILFSCSTFSISH